ncbi:hypothetical protein MMC13_008228 [Lambiella insularis]|nr:hypothetical protein [Lambiella insularis]
MRFIPAAFVTLLNLTTFTLAHPEARYGEHDLYAREAYADAYANAYEDVYAGLQARDLNERDPLVGIHFKSKKIPGKCDSPKKSYPASMGGGRNARMFCVIAGGGHNLSFVLEEPYKVKYEERPIPELESPNDVLVQISWTGICGSDVHYYTDGRIGSFVLEKPMILGHESSGIIHSVGSSVKTLSPGDRVALEPGVPCRTCPRCKTGFYNLCPQMEFASTPPYDGTLTKFYALPEDLMLQAAGQYFVRGRGRDRANRGSRAYWPVGLLCAGVSGAFGAQKVVMVDIQEKRLEFAQKWVCGVNIAIYNPGKGLSADENAAKLISQNGLGDGADIVIDASGAEPSVATGLAALRTGGTYVQGGMGRPEINFPILKVCVKEVTVRGSFRYGSGDYKLAVELVAAGKVDVKGLITGKVGFWEAEKAFGLVKAGEGIKTLIEGVKD